MLQLLLDDTYLTSLIDVPVTGGWQNWQTLQVSDIELPAGKHELVIKFYFGGFNFNLMEFELTAVNVDDHEETSFNFNLQQNYPNPFNPSTEINYSIPTVGISHDLSSTNVVLKIYDILGCDVATLVNEKQSPGNYSVKFNASNLPTGIYFCKLQSGGSTQSKKMILLK